MDSLRPARGPATPCFLCLVFVAGTVTWSGAAAAAADAGTAAWPATVDSAAAMSAAADSATAGPVRVTPAGVLWRSAALPGWGQWRTGHRVKAALFAGASAGWLTAAVVEASRIGATSDPARRLDRTAQRNTRVLWYLITATLAGIDAYVDAQLADFDLVADSPEVAGVALQWRF